MDYYKEGQLVKVNSGKHKDEYRKITKVNPDGTFETEEVDIAEEIKKARGA
jgi:transcription antitermination factor NusG